MTNDLCRRVSEHKEGKIKGFTQKHNVKRLVYFEESDNPISAIQREKAMKKWNRQWKIDLIEEINPLWEDLSKQICD